MIDTPDYVAFKCYQGKTFQRTFTITDASTGNPVSLANVTEIKFNAAEDESDTATIAGSIASGMFAITAPATAGVFTMTMADEVTAEYDFDVLKYEISMEYADGTKDVWYYGPFELVRSVPQ